MTGHVDATAVPYAVFSGDYESPMARPLFLQPEGVLCSSVEGVAHDDFYFGEEFDI